MRPGVAEHLASGMKVVLKGFMAVSADDLDSVRAHLDTHIQLTRAESGCITFHVAQRAGNGLIFDVYEEFVDEAAYFSHQERVKTSSWGNVARNVERHYEVLGLEG